MAQQFEQPQGDGELRAQRMTADESRAVIDLWQQERVEQTGLTDKPAVPDVAEGLDITVEDVQRLLQEVRAKHLEEERALEAEQALAQAERRLAEEEADLAEFRRKRAELRHQAEEDAWRNAVPWQPPKAVSQIRRGKPRQPPSVEWTGAEDFWQETEEDNENREKYRAERTKITSKYTLFVIVSLGFPVVFAFLLLLFNALLGLIK